MRDPIHLHLLRANSRIINHRLGWHRLADWLAILIWGSWQCRVFGHRQRFAGFCFRCETRDES